ncbi:MAG: hypothetical protein AAFV25_12120 [Bacteroidota bacterium]
MKTKKYFTLLLLLALPGLALANEGQKLLGILFDFELILYLGVFLFFGLPIVLLIRPPRIRLAVFSLMNLALMFRLVDELIGNLEFINGKAILVILLILQGFVTYFTLSGKQEDPNVTSSGDDPAPDSSPTTGQTPDPESPAPDLDGEPSIS